MYLPPIFILREDTAAVMVAGIVHMSPNILKETRKYQDLWAIY